MNDVAPKQSLGKKLGIGCLVVIGLFVALGILGAIVGDGKKANSTGDKPEAEAAEQVAAATDVTAKEISAAFQENEAKAKLAYDGKVLRVTGTVKDIDLDFSDDPVIKLAGSGEVQGMGISQNGKMTDVSVNGLSKEDAANISKGTQMVFLCKGAVNEVLGAPQLGDCSIAAGS
ncbi:MAG: hypothetical protein J7530_12430 [Novosphingobium sp.]|nr:hypothetical protein [Novosphingobium sp.]